MLLCSTMVPSWHGRGIRRVTSVNLVSLQRSSSITTTSAGSRGSIVTGSEMTHARHFVITRSDIFHVTRCFHSPANEVSSVTYCAYVYTIIIQRSVLRWLQKQKQNCDEDKSRISQMYRRKSFKINRDVCYYILVSFLLFCWYRSLIFLALQCQHSLDNLDLDFVFVSVHTLCDLQICKATTVNIRYASLLEGLQGCNSHYELGMTSVFQNLKKFMKLTAKRQNCRNVIIALKQRQSLC